jgi:hypothetical protein
LDELNMNHCAQAGNHKAPDATSERQSTRDNALGLSLCAGCTSCPEGFQLTPVRCASMNDSSRRRASASANLRISPNSRWPHCCFVASAQADTLLVLPYVEGWVPVRWHAVRLLHSVPCKLCGSSTAQGGQLPCSHCTAARHPRCDAPSRCAICLWAVWEDAGCLCGGPVASCSGGVL